MTSIPQAQAATSTEDDVLLKAMAALQAAGLSLDDLRAATNPKGEQSAPRSVELHNPEPTAAPPMRPEARPAMRADDPRARAAARAAQLRDHGALNNDGVDNFALPSNVAPDGWEYEWKTRTVYGAENPAYQVKLAMAGWDPVPADRHPELMPKDWSGKTIERDGLVLMERPKEICEDARNKERRKAGLQVRDKEAQLNGSPQGQFERSNKGDPLVRVRKGMEPIQIPEA